MIDTGRIVVHDKCYSKQDSIEQHLQLRVTSRLLVQFSAPSIALIIRSTGRMTRAKPALGL